MELTPFYCKVFNYGITIKIRQSVRDFQHILSKGTEHGIGI
jgi:hypothetical protein